ncbi:MAG: hypothetical protein IJW24_00885 [Clostridia bacterium]|nr:hypothetical protein [Clostridia bacterium]
MVSNIVIVGINRKMSRSVAEMVAEQLGMHFLDTIELFEFDNIPRNLSTILKEQGEAYFRKKEKSLSGYVGEFENTVIHAESGSVLEESNVEKLKQNAVVVYLHAPISKTKAEIHSADYQDGHLKKFFDVSLEKVRNRANLWKIKADIVVETKSGSALKVSADAIRAIEAYFIK